MGSNKNYSHPPAGPHTLPDMLDLHASACLEKNWSVLAMLVALVRRLVQSTCFTRGMKHRANHLLRLAEGFTRRLLVLRAQAFAPDPPSPQRAASSKPPQPGRRDTARNPALSLFEALPSFPRYPVEPIAPAPPRLPAPADPNAEADPACATRRLGVLEDVLRRPEHHARRMAVWLKRFSARTGRYTPFCLGRPPGITRRPDDPELAGKIRDADFFARRVLMPAPG